MKCCNCGRLFPDDSEFCQYCGNKIENKKQAVVFVPIVKTVKTVKEHRVKKSLDKKSKIRFCKMCGGQIDAQTRKCGSCGKQYFKGVKFGKNLIIVVLVIVLIISVLVNVIQYNKNATLHKRVSTLNNENIILNSKMITVSEGLLQQKNDGDSVYDLLDYKVKKEQAEKIAREFLDKTNK